MEGVTLMLVAVVVLAVIFDYINGFHDTANAIATSVATRALSPRNAIIMATTFNFVGAFAGTDKRAEAERRARAVLEQLNLGHLADQRAGNLTIADCKRLEIAKALATRPRLLLLDEVMAGLRPTEVDEMVAIIKRLREGGMTVFVIEHIMRAIMALSDRIAVLHFGTKIAEGTPQEIAHDERVIKAYLGEDYGAA